MRATPAQLRETPPPPPPPRRRPLRLPPGLRLPDPAGSAGVGFPAEAGGAGAPRAAQALALAPPSDRSGALQPRRSPGGAGELRNYLVAVSGTLPSWSRCYRALKKSVLVPSSKDAGKGKWGALLAVSPQTYTLQRELKVNPTKSRLWLLGRTQKAETPRKVMNDQCPREAKWLFCLVPPWSEQASGDCRAPTTVDNPEKRQTRLLGTPGGQLFSHPFPTQFSPDIKGCSNFCFLDKAYQDIR